LRGTNDVMLFGLKMREESGSWPRRRFHAQPERVFKGALRL
jgi:hypothetical protein